MPIVLSDTVYSLADTVGAIMSSIVGAQAQSARSTVDFINEVAFETEQGAASTERRVRTVQFKYQKLDELDQPAEFTLEVPLLSLVNIPSIGIRSAKISFSYDITLTEETAAAGPSSTPPGKFSVPPRVAGRVVKRQGTEIGALDVEIDIESAAPIGVQRILDMLEVAVSSRKSDPGLIASDLVGARPSGTPSAPPNAPPNAPSSRRAKR